MARQPRKHGPKNQQASAALWWTEWFRGSKQMMVETLSANDKNPFAATFKKIISTPVTIFDPEIVQQTLQKAQKSLTIQLEKKPQRFFEIQQDYAQGFQKLFENTVYRLQGGTVEEPVIQPESHDKRFKDPDWEENFYFDFLKQAYLLQAQLLKDTVNRLDGLDPKTHQKVDFYMRCFVDAVAPSNFPLTNPVVMRETRETQGENLVKGYTNFIEDFVKNNGRIRMTDKEAFQLGRDLAATPGKVVFQNDLFQLIQYSPLSAQVAEAPLLIIPPWVNKYYIFDLQQENSFIRWAVESGLTVFTMSWVNPDERHAAYTFSDYTLNGVEQAVSAVRDLTHSAKVNTLGYCAGGISLTCLLAYLGKRKRDWIASATVIAAPIDTSMMGDLLVYICEEQLKKLEIHMKKEGYLCSDAMMMSFNMLRANELIWSFYINNYLLGREPIPFDLLYWNSDSTRMPARMHSEYLRQIFLENRLMATGKKAMKIGGVSLKLSDIKVPLFVFGAKDDHIVPWRSIYPLTQQVSGPVKFVLGESGHVAGVMNHPQRQKYGYWFGDNLAPQPETWMLEAQNEPGSWWPHWRQWLQKYSGKDIPARVPDPSQVIEDAPGRYVLMRSDREEVTVGESRPR